ncbi:MAG: MEDS domain-containing protein, partial [Nitrososphaeraceae archaeon]
MSESGSHILAVYPNKDKELEDAIRFLKIGLESNEAGLLIINEEDISKEEVQERLHSKYNIPYNEINELQTKGDISIVTSSEWYLSNNGSTISTISGSGCSEGSG